MRTIRFNTSTVFDASMRALDELRRMNFALISMAIENGPGEIARIRIDYEPKGNLSARTWFLRVREMPDVFECSDTGPDGAVRDMSVQERRSCVAG